MIYKFEGKMRYNQVYIYWLIDQEFFFFLLIQRQPTKPVTLNTELTVEVEEHAAGDGVVDDVVPAVQVQVEVAFGASWSYVWSVTKPRQAQVSQERDKDRGKRRTVEKEKNKNTN